MNHISINTGTINVRDDLVAAHQRAWGWLAKAGTWLDGSKRLAVVAEIRNALDCPLCKEAKAVLSPNAVTGSHTSLGDLNVSEVGVIHRIVNDSGRTNSTWCRDAIEEGGIGDGAYVEMAGITAMVMMMDTVKRGLGLPFDDLPAAEAGEPTRYVSTGAKREAAWVPIIEPEDVTESDQPLYPSDKAGYIYRSLSSVPDSMRAYWDLASDHYLPGQYVYQFGVSIRAIARMQMELIAARVSAIHQCAY
jgi:hypothetical protein